MLNENTETGNSSKTVQSEAIRLTAMVIHKQIIDKSIPEPRASALCKQITDVLYTIYNDDPVALLQLETIEAQITCPKCHGTGMVTVSDGYDTPYGYRETDSWVEPCKCCGGLQ